MKLSENIKKLRKQRGFKQEQLAEVMGVSIASVSKWETGQTAPELTVLMELADFFEVSMDTLVGHSLNANRMESLITKMQEATDNREEETAAALCEKILRNYPNDANVVDSCAKVYYQLFIYTNKKVYMELCIAQTNRLMSLKQGEPERERLERMRYLGNQYTFLEQWDIAKSYYEQSNVGKCNDGNIAECFLKKGEYQTSVHMSSKTITNDLFFLYQKINTLVESWIALGEYEKAAAALEWIYGVIEPLSYTNMMLWTQLKLVDVYKMNGTLESAQSSIRKAAQLVREDKKQNSMLKADFLQLEEEPKMLISVENNRELVKTVAESMGRQFLDIVGEVLR